MSGSVLLIDLASGNGRVDWPTLARHGIAGAWRKATEGATYNDPGFGPARQAAHAAGVPLGAYHFARPDRNTAEAEAEHFCRMIGEVREHELRPALDMEHPAGVDREEWERAVAKVDLEAWARAFNHRVKAELGVGPIFYSYSSFILEHVKPQHGPIGYGLWLAVYDRNDGAEHPFTVPPPWKRAVAHQFTSRARVAGVEGFVDLSSAPSLRPLLAHPTPLPPIGADLYPKH